MLEFSKSSSRSLKVGVLNRRRERDGKEDRNAFCLDG
jgi:hypothetical protein